VSFGALPSLVFPMGFGTFAFLLSYALSPLVFPMGLAFAFGVLYVATVGLPNGNVSIGAAFSCWSFVAASMALCIILWHFLAPVISALMVTILSLFVMVFHFQLYCVRHIRPHRTYFSNPSLCGPSGPAFGV
ncbi:hypothetical protein A2U01_0002317, partial [Trifolium medium]|nr:hypothetical protein [Trifolium medium]